MLKKFWLLVGAFWVLYNVGSSWFGWLEVLTVVPAACYAAAIAVVVVFLFWRYRRWDWLGIVMALLFCVNVLNMYWGGRLVAPVHAQPQARTICSWNTAYFFYRSSTRQEALADWSKRQCDVYLMQEVWNFNVTDAQVAQAMAQYFPGYHFIRRGEFVTVTKGTLVDNEFPYYEGYLKTTIAFGDQIIDVYNIHIWYPLHDRSCQYFGGAAANSCAVVSAFSLRQLQSQALTDSLSQARHHILVAGDFNSLPNHYLIKELDRTYFDIRSSHWWSNVTFPSRYPLLKIDYVFVGNGLENDLTGYSRHCQQPFSDHCWQEIQIKP